MWLRQLFQMAYDIRLLFGEAQRADPVGNQLGDYADAFKKVRFNRLQQADTSFVKCLRALVCACGLSKFTGRPASRLSCGRHTLLDDRV